jgi:hypothetical protein
MTEQDKLAAYMYQTLAMDESDTSPAAAQRVHDITGAWMTRASEPPELPSGWRETVRLVMQRMDLGVLPDTPTQATTQINAGLDTFIAAISQANTQVQSLAMRDEIIKNQSNILDSFDVLLKLESGKLYIDMVPMLQALVEKAGTAPTQ